MVLRVMVYASQVTGCTPVATWPGACPSRTPGIYCTGRPSQQHVQPDAHPIKCTRLPSPCTAGLARLLRDVDWAAFPVLCQTHSRLYNSLGTLPPQAYATSHGIPRLGALPDPRWQCMRSRCQHHFASINAVCIAGLTPRLEFFLLLDLFSAVHTGRAGIYTVKSAGRAGIVKSRPTGRAGIYL